MPGSSAERIIAQQHAYDKGLPRAERLRWAKLALRADRRPADRATEFNLRAWVIDRLDPGPGDPDWDPGTLAADTLAALSLDPARAAELAGRWRSLPIEQIRELRRHKNLTAHLDLLMPWLSPGPVTAQLRVWQELRRQLP